MSDRPLNVLKRIGFTGTDQQILEQVARLIRFFESGELCFLHVTANAATVSPQCRHQRWPVHFTVANLVANFHRSIEPEQTSAIPVESSMMNRHSRCMMPALSIALR